MPDTEIKTTAEAEEEAALPGLGEVHLDNQKAVCVPEELSKKAARKSAARWAYERLILYIQNFEAQLDNEHEVAMGFTGSNAGTLRIEGMGYFDPDMVTFYGTDPSGGRTQLIQHVSQLSVILRAMPKTPDRESPNRIGFRLARELDEDVPATG